MYSVSITTLKKFLFEKSGSPVCNKTIPFHLTKPNSTVSCPTFLGLPGELGHLAPGSGVELIIHHVLEALLEGGADENWDRQALSTLSVLHHFVALTLLLHLVQVLSYLFHCHVAHEGRPVGLSGSQSGKLSRQTLDKMSDGHARGDGVRVDDDVGRDTLLSEGEVFTAVCHADSALLAVSGGELVADLWDTDAPQLHFHQLVVVGIVSDYHSINHPCVLCFNGHTSVLRWDLVVRVFGGKTKFFIAADFADNDILPVNTAAWQTEPVHVQFRVLELFFHANALVAVGDAHSVLLLAFVL